MSRWIVGTVGAVVAIGLIVLGQGFVQPPPAHAGGTLLIVNTPIDEDEANGTCSLREAIIAANGNANYRGCFGVGFGFDGIEFSLGPGTPVINITLALPTITDPVSIDGAPNRVELRGPGGSFQNGFNGLTIADTAPATSIRNLVINSFRHNGIEAFNAGLVVEGSYIGVLGDGATAAPNVIYGIEVSGANPRIGGTDGTTPGGSCTGDCNVISANGFGGVWVRPTATGAVIQGNFVGLDATGTAALPNTAYDGIRITAPNALIGGITPAARNVVFASYGGLSSGIDILGTSFATVQGNFIGTDSTGASMPSDLVGLPSVGIHVEIADNVLIGGGAGAGNLISGNSIGILIDRTSHDVQVRGNFIGTAADGQTPLPNEQGIYLQQATGNVIGGPGEGNVIAYSTDIQTVGENAGITIRSLATGNTIRGNSIYSNDDKGIETIAGGNNELPPPVITGLGSIHGTACPTCTIDIYSDDEDEGRVYEGTTLADGSGEWEFTGSLTGPFVTATATDTGGNTSEFSAPFDPTPPTPTPSPSPSPSSSPSPSPTPTGSPGPDLTQGDINCDNAINDDDLFALFRFVAGLSSGDQPSPCPDIGDEIDGFPWGDINCDGDVNLVDVLYLVAHQAGITLEPVAPGCVPVGDDFT